MSLLPTLSLLATLVYLGLGSMALVRDPRARLNRTFALLCGSFGIWAFGFAFMYDAPSAEACWAWDRVASLGWTTWPGLALRCSLLLAGHRRTASRNWLLALATLPSLTIFVSYQLMALGTDIGYQRLPLGWSPDPTAVIGWFYFYEVYSVACIATSLLVLARWRGTATLARERRQASAVLTSAAVAFGTAFGIDIVVDSFDIGRLPPMAPILIVVFAAGVAFAMSRLQLMSLTPATASDRILEGVRDLVLLVAPDGTIRDANPQVQAALGWTGDGLAGRHLGLVLGDEGDAKRVLDATREAGQGVFPLEVTWMHHDGGRLPVWLWAAPVHDPGGDWIGAVLVGRDLSDQRRAEDQMVRTSGLESLALLSTGLAHDFNNLMTVVVANLELAREAAGSDVAVTGKLDEAGLAADAARQLAQRLLAFHRGPAGNRLPVDLGRLVRDAGPVALRGSNVRLEIDVAPDLPVVIANAGQVAQVLQNLLLNARQAMSDEGTVTVAVRECDGPPPGGLRPGGPAAGSPDAPPAGPPGRWVCVSVRDEGPGIPPEVLSRLWEPFFTTKPGGSGLGLPSSLSIVRRHGGTILVSSTPGNGATFLVYLPAAG